MKINQVYEIVNTMTTEMLGDSVVLQEDLTNIVDVGTALENLNSEKWLESAYGKLNDVIGRWIVVNRPFSSPILSVLLQDSWTYGSALRKISITNLMDAEENPTWNLQVGKSVDPNIYYGANVAVTMFNTKDTFEIPLSVVDVQIREAFRSASDMAAFVSALYSMWTMSMDVKLAEFCRRVMNDMIAETVWAEYVDEAGTTLTDLGAKTGVKAVNVLKKYNDEFGTQLTVATAVNNADFLRYLALQLMNHSDRMAELSGLYNMKGYPRHTPKDSEYQKVVMHSEIKNAAEVYLYSETFHDQYVQLINAVSVPYFQGVGQKYEFADTAKIDIITSQGHAVEIPAVLAVMFDRDAMMVSCIDKRIKSNYVPRQEFTNSWAKVDVGLLEFQDENMIVFFMADAPTESGGVTA